MKANTTLPLIAAVLLLPSTYCFGQGALTPPGAPASSQKTLQQIWDHIGTLEATVTNRQTLIQQQNTMIDSLAAILGASLPWTLTTVDSTVGVGFYTSLAFTPGGQPAISYWDGANGGLKFAIRKPFGSP